MGAWASVGVNREFYCSFAYSASACLTGSPRLAANPANAILNYLYALLESEARLAAAALGLDPGLGVLHVDTQARDSLACDLMEAVRPQVDGYLLDWITRQPLRREWFFEQRDAGDKPRVALCFRENPHDDRRPFAEVRQADKQRQHANARLSWTPSNQLKWLADDAYSNKIQPLLARMSNSAIASRIGVSRWYAGRIRQGHRPHPRHWQALATLVGL